MNVLPKQKKKPHTTQAVKSSISYKRYILNNQRKYHKKDVQNLNRKIITFELEYTYNLKKNAKWFVN